MVKVWQPEAAAESRKPFLIRYHYLILAALIGLATAIILGPRPDGLSLEGQRVLGIFALCIGLWVTGLIPLQITSILAIILLPMLRVMPSSEAFSLFGNSAVFFILGAFILSAVLVDCGLTTRLSCVALDRFASSPAALRNVILFGSAFASFWMSEHAVAAMLFPIVLSLVRAMGLKPGESHFAKSFFFALAWGCVIGGIATYLGGARNPLAAGILFEETGIQISFVAWLTASLPLVLLMMGWAWLVLKKMYPEEPVDMEAARALLETERSRLGPVSSREWGVAALSLLTIAGWITLHRVFGLASMALMSVALMFMFRLTRWDTIESSVNWGIILMYGGAIALGSALHTTGASTWVIEHTLGGTSYSPYVLVIILGTLSLVLTEFISNAAVVSVMTPLALGLAASQGLSPQAVTLAVALPSGLAYILPMGTPATAIAYGSGYMTMRDFLRAGILMAALSLLMFALTVRFYWPLLGY